MLLPGDAWSPQSSVESPFRLDSFLGFVERDVAVGDNDGPRPNPPDWKSAVGASVEPVLGESTGMET